ncbi:MAG: ribulose-phosphate 3-epimerase [Oscillospiraceae bacterium]|nr:ribulose-phosphate 3-epimerase [Oscillospiraceae bacterium]
MSELSASVLSADLSDLAAECRRTRDCGVKMIHFDVMDGHFVPNISYGAPVLKCLKKAVPDMVYDVHLMISEPARYAPDFAKAGADYITFHYEAVPDAVDKTIAAIRETGCKVGLSINPGTDPQVIFPWLDKLDLVLVMGVNPGFGGQSFMPATPERIAAVKAECVRRGLSPRIEVDGGVNAQTGALCADAGADLLVMGSAFYGAKDPAALAETVRGL